jgi:NADP-reducing hydrogenase subunit HndB
MKSLEELRALKSKIRSEMELKEGGVDTRVVVGMATCGIAAGARPVMNAIVEGVANRGIKNVQVTMTGCMGLCRLEPIVEVIDKDGNIVTYVEMNAEKAAKVVEEHLAGGRIVSEYTIGAVAQ